MTGGRFISWCIFALLLIGFSHSAEASLLNMDIDKALTCSSGGSPSSMSIFKYNNQGATPVTCDGTGGFFSRFMCIFETTLGMVIAVVFCHLSQAWVEPFGALALLMMAALGIGFITGITEFTMKEMAIAMFKIGLIAAFAFNTDIALKVAFAFFMNVVQNTVEMFGQAITGGPPIPIDSFQGADDALEAGVKPAIRSCENTGIIGFFASAALIIMFLVIIIVMPFIGLLFLSIAVNATGFFARAAFGYLYSLVLLTFLIAAMPIFLSLALFKVTRDSFESWLAHLFSNTVQIMLVFAFLAFARMVDFGEFLRQVDSLMVLRTFSVDVMPFKYVAGDLLGGYCTICVPNIVSHPDYPTLKLIAAAPNQCKTPVTPVPWLDIIDQTEFLYFLLVNGLTFYVLTKTMMEFMKMVPEIAQTLGGHDSSMTIGGAPRNFSPQSENAINAPGLTVGSLQFEKGVANALRVKQKNTKHGFIRRNLLFSRIGAAIGEGRRSAKYGAHDLSRDEFHSIRKKRAKAIALAEKGRFDAQAAMESLKKEQENAATQKQEVDTKIAEADGEIAALLQQLKEARDKNASASEIAKLEVELSKLEGLKKELELKKTEIEDLQKQLGETETKLADESLKADERLKLEKEKQELEDKQQRAKAAAKELEEQLKKDEKGYEDLLATVGGADAVNTQLHEIEGKIAVALAALNKAKEGGADKSVIQKLEAEIATLEELKKDFEQKKTETAAAQKELDQKARGAAKSRGPEKEINTLSGLKQELEQKKAELAVKKEEMDKKAAELEKKRNKNKKKTQEELKFEKDRKELEAEFTRVKESLHKVDRDLLRSHQDFSAAMAEFYGTDAEKAIETHKAKLDIALKEQEVLYASQQQWEAEASSKMVQFTSAVTDFEKALKNQEDTLKSWNDPMRERSLVGDYDELLTREDLVANKTSHGVWDDIHHRGGDDDLTVADIRKKRTWYQMLDMGSD